MENNNQKENTDYQFIREKVVSKRRSRLKRICFSFLFTVFLAAVFGFVARLIFLYSDGPIRRFLGLEAETGEGMPPTSEEITPSAEPAPTTQPSPTPTKVPTESPTEMPAAETPVPVTPEPTIAGEDEHKPGDGKTEEAAEGAALVEEIYNGLQQIAVQVKQSMATITVSVTGIDWLNDPYETESETMGILVEKTEEHLLYLVNLDRIQSASHISLTIDKVHYEAALWNYDKDYNLAIIEVAAAELPQEYLEQVQKAVFGESSSLKVGNPILALGNPNGYMGSMELGMVTSIGSVYYITDNSVELFNTNTTDSESGDGVITNLKGEIVGIITRTLKSGLNAEVCTAIGMTRLKNVINRMTTGEQCIYFGITGENIPASVLNDKGLNNGIYVIEAATDSPAYEAGIKTGDIILKVDEINIYSYSGFNTTINLHRNEEPVTVTIQRTVRMNPKIMELTVVLSNK